MNFPNSPSLNQTYAYGGKTWKWNGDGWELVVTNLLTGYAGANTITTLGTITTGTWNGSVIGVPFGGTGLSSYTPGSFLYAVDATTLGQRSAAQVLVDIGALASSAYTAADVLSKLLTVDGAASGLDADLLDGQQGSYYLPASTYTAADVRTKLLTVDGAGSGIDADLLDGLNSVDFARRDGTLTYTLGTTGVGTTNIWHEVFKWTVTAQYHSFNAKFNLTRRGLLDSRASVFVRGEYSVAAWNQYPTALVVTGDHLSSEDKFILVFDDTAKTATLYYARNSEWNNTFATMIYNSCISAAFTYTNTSTGSATDPTGNYVVAASTLANHFKYMTHYNDGAGSNFDADLLDGQHGSYYLDLTNATGTLGTARLPTTIMRNSLVAVGPDSLPAATFWTDGDGPQLKVYANTTGSTGFPEEFGVTWSFRSTASASSSNYQRAFDLHKGSNSNHLYVRTYNSSGVPNTFDKLWTSSNDGAASGLDADLLDGQQGSYYLDLTNATGTLSDARLSSNIPRKDGTNDFTGTFTVSGGSSAFSLKAGATADHVYISLYADSQAQTTRSGFIGFGAVGNAGMSVANEMANGNINLSTNGTGLVTINNNLAWHQGNDGTGSGLDADLLDGQQGSYYSAFSNLTGKPTTLTGYGITDGIKLDDTIMNNNSFGGRRLYNATIDNALAAADKRYYVTVTTHLQTYLAESYPKLNPAWVSSYSVSGSGTSFTVTGAPSAIVVYNNTTLCTVSGSPSTQYQYSYSGGTLTFGATVSGTITVYPDHTVPQYLDSPVQNTLSSSQLFDNDYDTMATAPVGQYLKIRIAATSDGNTGWNGYPYGDYFLSYYYTETSGSAEYRSYNRNYHGHGIGWEVMPMTDFIGTNAAANYVQKVTDNTNYGRTIVEFIVHSHASHPVSVSEVEWKLQRPNMQVMPVVTKHAANKLFHALTLGTQTANNVTISPLGTIDVSLSMTIGGNTVWHTGNLTPSNYLLSSAYTAADVLSKLLTVDGAASGLDSDLLDGQHGSHYLDLTNATGTLAVARLPALTGGDVTSPVGSSTLTIAAGAVSLAKMATIPATRILGNDTGGALTPKALTAAEVKTMLALVKADVGLGIVENTALSTWAGSTNITTLGTIASGTWNGSVIGPAYLGTGTRDGTRFLRDDGTWVVVATGGGSVTSVSVVTANGVSGSVATATTTPAITLTLGAITPTSVAASGSVTGSNLSGTNTGDQTITLTGDVTGSGVGSFAATIGNNTVTLAKMADMATASFLGRNTAATGDPEVLSVATVKTMLNLTGTNSGDQTITLTGDVTGSGTGSFAATIGNGTVTLAKMANLAANSIMGNNTGSAATPLALTAAQVRTLLNVADGATANAGTVTSVSVVTANGVSGSVATSTTAPAITLTLGAITPTSVAATGAVSGTALTVGSGTTTSDVITAGAMYRERAGALTTAAVTLVNLDTWATATFRSAKYVIQVTDTVTGNVHMTELLVMRDNSNNVYLTEYASMVSGSNLVTFSADYDGTANVRLRITPASANSTQFKFSATIFNL